MPSIDSSGIVAITGLDWIAVGPDVVALEELCFAPSIRETPEYLFELAESPSSIFLIFRNPAASPVIGYLAADRLERFGDVPGTAADPHFGHQDTLYLYGVAVHPDWRHRGIGNALQTECLQQAARKGFRRTTAHVARNAAAKIGLGTRALMTFQDRYGTGQEFDYVELMPANIPL